MDKICRYTNKLLVCLLTLIFLDDSSIVISCKAKLLAPYIQYAIARVFTFKRIAFRKGRIAAVTATARKLAVIIWNMLIKVEPYRKNDVKFNTQKQRLRMIRQFEKRVVSLQLNETELKKMFTRYTF